MLLGFTMFKDEILDGRKTQTIRLLGKRPPPMVFETLHLYWHLRRKDCELLHRLPCTYSIVVSWRTIKNNLRIALADGFKSLKAFREWFISRYNPTDDTLFVIIRWRRP